MEPNYKKTLFACYRAYITQAIVVNLAPLFFVLFREDFGLSFTQIAQLVSLNFISQLIVDVFSITFVDKIGYRKCIIVAHLVVFIGLCGMGILPMLINPYTALILCTVVYAIGSGLIEVLISPIVSYLPGEAKASSMNLLHSFYSWGQMLVVLLTTIALKLIGDEYWYIIPLLWSLVPLYNLFGFIKVPIIEPEEKANFKILVRLAGKKFFWVALVLMICAGSSEIVMAQWASLFAEKGLGVNKVLGDILGPCLFALFMGIGRTIYGIFGDKINLKKWILFTSAGTIACYLVTVFVNVPFVALLACALTGFMISAMWPGVLAATAGEFPLGGTAMFGVLAMFGDMGCSAGPMLSGWVSDLAVGRGYSESLGMKAGILAAVIFPIGMLVGMVLLKSKNKQL